MAFQNLSIHSMQFQSEFEKSQSFGVARKQSEIVRVGTRVRRTGSKTTESFVHQISTIPSEH